LLLDTESVDARALSEKLGAEALGVHGV